MCTFKLIQVLMDNLDLLVHEDPEDPQVQLDREVNLERLDPEDLPEMLEDQDHKETVVNRFV